MAVGGAYFGAGAGAGARWRTCCVRSRSTPRQATETATATATRCSLPAEKKATSRTGEVKSPSPGNRVTRGRDPAANDKEKKQQTSFVALADWSKQNRSKRLTEPLVAVLGQQAVRSCCGFGFCALLWATKTTKKNYDEAEHHERERALFAQPTRSRDAKVARLDNNNANFSRLISLQ